MHQSTLCAVREGSKLPSLAVGALVAQHRFKPTAVEIWHCTCSGRMARIRTLGLTKGKLEELGITDVARQKPVGIGHSASSHRGDR